MQNKFFGDIHDFYKFYFLKHVSMDYSLGIHWCLEPDELNRNIGNLSLTKKEQNLDSELYELLNNCKANKNRNVDNIKPYFKRNMRYGVKYFNQMHEFFYFDMKYEEKAIECLGNQDIIFFDPDNGIEGRGTSNKNKYKYVSYRLLKHFWDLGKSLIIIQFERSPKQTDEKIEILYTLLKKEPSIVTVKKGTVKYICAINGGHGAGHYKTLDVLAQLQYGGVFKVENWKGTGGIG